MVILPGERRPAVIVSRNSWRDILRRHSGGPQGGGRNPFHRMLRDKWIPGSCFARPGMTERGAVYSAAS